MPGFRRTEEEEKVVKEYEELINDKLDNRGSTNSYRANQ